MSWQQTLIDEESCFLRGVNEGYRTWCLRNQKIRLLQNQLDEEASISTKPLEQSSRLEMRVQQLKAMTLGQQPDTQDDVVQAVQGCEAAMAKLAPLLGVAGLTPELAAKTLTEPSSVAEDSCDADSSTTARASAKMEAASKEDIAKCLDAYREQMHILDMKVDKVFEIQYDADVVLKEFEAQMLVQWREKKQASENWTKRYAALTGMRSAMRAALQRFERQSEAGSSTFADDSTAKEEKLQRLDLRQPPQEASDGGSLERSKVYGKDELEEQEDIEESWQGLEPGADNGMHALSDVLAEGVADPKEREEILKREHPGSKDHPHACRPCHFQGGLCWKGLACSFCHICPKPKRKSKHQRDVDKRRQERYKQVKDEIGIPCLDELTKIDDVRRQIMASSEEAKKRVKEAFFSRQQQDVSDAQDMVKQMQSLVENYHASMPFVLSFEEGAELESDIDADASDSDADAEKNNAKTASRQEQQEEAKAAEVGERTMEELLESTTHARVDQQEKSSQSSKASGTALHSNSKPQRRGGQNLRAGSSGQGKGKHNGSNASKGSKGWEMDMESHGNKGWGNYPPEMMHGGWGNSGGPPLMDPYWYGKGQPAYPPPPQMYFDAQSQWCYPNNGDTMWSDQAGHSHPGQIDSARRPEDAPSNRWGTEGPPVELCQ